MTATAKQITKGNTEAAVISLKAAETLAAVKRAVTAAGLYAGTGDRAIGVVLDTGASGDLVPVATSGVVNATAGGNINMGDYVSALSKTIDNVIVKGFVGGITMLTTDQGIPVNAMGIALETGIAFDDIQVKLF